MLFFWWWWQNFFSRWLPHHTIFINRRFSHIREEQRSWLRLIYFRFECVCVWSLKPMKRKQVHSFIEWLAPRTQCQLVNSLLVGVEITSVSIQCIRAWFWFQLSFKTQCELDLIVWFFVLESIFACLPFHKWRRYLLYSNQFARMNKTAYTQTEYGTQVYSIRYSALHFSILTLHTHTR